MTIDYQHPLTWPEGEPRTPGHEKRGKSQFATTRLRTERQLEDELKRFKATDAILSFNVARRGRVDDTAVALFFSLPDGRQISICCDLYLSQDDNMRAIYMVIDAMRTIARYGGDHLSQKSFTGFAALPPPKDVWSILGLNKDLGQRLSPKLRREYVMEAFRERAKEGHGKGHDMSALVEARDIALQELGVTDAG